MEVNRSAGMVCKGGELCPTRWAREGGRNLACPTGEALHSAGLHLPGREDTFFSIVGIIINIWYLPQGKHCLFNPFVFLPNGRGGIIATPILLLRKMRHQEIQ